MFIMNDSEETLKTCILWGMTRTLRWTLRSSTVQASEYLNDKDSDFATKWCLSSLPEDNSIPASAQTTDLEKVVQVAPPEPYFYYDQWQVLRITNGMIVLEMKGVAQQM